MSKPYKAAGVDIDSANALIEAIKPMAQATQDKQVLSGLGGFGGLYTLPKGYHEPVLVSGTDGVGTKLLCALAWQRHDNIGVDLVAMCVNDILTIGAKPLYFLDYYATGKLDVPLATQIIHSIAQGCLEAECALIGGETAEMPGCYEGHHYDLAGFAVGIVEKANIIDGSQVKTGDKLIALASNGIHANGFSLIRHHLDSKGIDASRITIEGQLLSDCLMAPTRIYVKPILSLLATCTIHAMVHITGGGLIDNIPRVLPPHLRAHLDLQARPLPPLFQWLKNSGGWDDINMAETFNMGIGYIICVPDEQVAPTLAHLSAQGEDAWVCGDIAAREQQPPVTFSHV